MMGAPMNVQYSKIIIVLTRPTQQASQTEHLSVYRQAVAHLLGILLLN